MYMYMYMDVKLPIAIIHNGTNMNVYIAIGVVLGFCLNAGSRIVHTSCENGWVPYEGYCYLMGHMNLSFVEAEHYCKQHRGHLAEPYTIQESNFLKAQLRQLKPHCAWIGVSDEMVQDSWRWYTGGDLVNFTDWGPNEPNVASEDCVMLLTTWDYKWADVSCNYPNCRPLCKQRGFTCGEEIIGK